MSIVNLKEKPVAAVIIGILAIVLIGLQFASNLTVLVRQMALKIEHPSDSSFQEYDNLLKAEVKDGRVNYQHTKNSQLLNDAIRKLEALNPDHIQDTKDRLCFWINAYNLLIIKSIADRFPVRTIKQISNDLHLRKFLIGGAPYSTQDIYLKELTPLLEVQPKSCFLICGGALGFPRLPDHALKGSALDSDSELAAKQFISNQENVSYNTNDKSKQIVLSPWFLWYEPVFTKKYGSPEKFVASYTQADWRKIHKELAFPIGFAGSFDWRINRQEKQNRDALQ